jgi:DNA-binding response OmpR family regulator
VSKEDLAAGVEPRSPFSALRVLLVEDNELVASSLATLLRRDGHRVDVAHTGAAALAAASACRPHVALVDIGLPDMDGYEVAGRFRGQEELRDVVLVALTGRCDEESRRLGERAGFACHLAKPIDFAGLSGVLACIEGRG